MKRLTLCLLLCAILVPQMLHAERRTRQQAQIVAERNVKKLGIKLATLSVKDVQRVRRTATTTNTYEDYYVFNHDNNKGFTIVGGDDRLPDVVGYSTYGTFNQDSIAPGLQWYLQMYADKVATLGTPEGDSLAAEMREYHRRFASEPRAAVNQMLNTTWGQGSPYSDNCPSYKDFLITQHCPAGCVAIAAAQILNYHKNPATLNSTIPGYTSSKDGLTNTISAIAGPRTYNWSNMNDSEKAKLVYHVGVSCEMQYGKSGSAAYLADMINALWNYWGMLSDGENYYYYASDIEKVSNSIDNHRPVLISAADANGGAGHAFVLDGRNDEGKYHINWGWSGSSDGWYDFLAMKPTGTSYSFTQSIGMCTNIRVNPALTALGNLKTTYNANSNAYTNHFYVAGTEPGFYPQNTVNDFNTTMATAKTIIDAEGANYSSTTMNATNQAIQDAVAALQNGRIRYNGYFFIETAMSYNDGQTKAMYDAGGYAKWKTLDVNDNSFQWALSYNEETKAYECVNRATGARIGNVGNDNDHVTTSTSLDVTSSALCINPIRFDTNKNCYFENMRHPSQTGNHHYLHQETHKNGAGTEGYIVGWEAEASPSLWHFELAEVDSAQLIRSKERKRLTTLADSIYDEVHSMTSTKLITNSSQFYSEYTDPTEGSFANLLDGDSTTYWHSTWQGNEVALGTHYFQVTLANPTEGFLKMFMARRDYNNDFDHITELGVKASNDASSWTDITTLSFPYNNCRESFYRTFNLQQPYKYLRFYINNTYCKNIASRGYGHLGEFQLYPAISDEKTEALETLHSTIAAQQEGAAIDDQIAAIRQAFRNFFGVGNVNTDTRTDISDAISILHILKQPTTDKYGTADVNADLVIDETDIDALIHILLNK